MSHRQLNVHAATDEAHRPCECHARRKIHKDGLANCNLAFTNTKINAIRQFLASHHPHVAISTIRTGSGACHLASSLNDLQRTTRARERDTDKNGVDQPPLRSWAFLALLHFCTSALCRVSSRPRNSKSCAAKILGQTGGLSRASERCQQMIDRGFHILPPC